MTRSLFPDDIVTTDAIRERIDDLEDDHADDEGEMTDVGLWDEAERREYRGLVELIEEIGGHPQDTVTLIHERHFRDYIRDDYAETYGGQYHEETREGMVRLGWHDIMSQLPFSCIDWDEVAEERRSGYSIAEVDGETYYYEGP